MSTEIRKVYYKNGQLQYKSPYQNGQFHGIRKWWLESGQLECEFPYQNGQLHGICRGWRKSGQLKYETTYQNGQLHGISKWWWEDGQLNHENYWLYDNEVSFEEYRKHKLITQLSGLKDEHRSQKRLLV